MANKPFIDGSSASAAYIVQHGAGSDFDNYFTYLYDLVGQTAPIISPGFMTNDNSSKYYLGDMNMAFDARGYRWVSGDNDVTGASCSSFDQLDAIIKYYSNSIKFPNLQRIVLIGHSGGGNLVSRYSTLTNVMPVQMRYIIVNAANEAYYNNIRPDLNATDSSCTSAYSYPYQWAGKGNSYVEAKMGDNVAQLFKQWTSRNVYHLTGDQDIQTTGTQTCQSLVQGGSYRRNRNYAYWAYLNLLAGTNTDVSAFHGYQAFKDQNITPISTSAPFNHRQCTVAGIGHNAPLMFKSDCGRAAILGSGNMPAGAGASYPSPITSTSNSTSTTAGDH
jgi:pimeloyl-ACP methyl ester carboxylesterase